MGRNCFRPLVELIRQEILSYPVIHVDESTLRVLRNEAGQKKTSSAYVWQIALPLYTGNFLNYYRVYPGRGRQYAENLLSADKMGVQGIISDNYGVYTSLAVNRGYRHALCYAHLRKYLLEAMEAAGSKDIYTSLFATYHHERLADGILRWHREQCAANPRSRPKFDRHRDAMLMLLSINLLFTHERGLDVLRSDYLDTVAAIRARESRPLVNVMLNCAKRLAASCCDIGYNGYGRKVYKQIGTEPYSKAAAYCLNGIKGFKAFLDEPRFPLSQARV